MLLLATLFANTAWAQTLSLTGTGTIDSPYQISSVADWNTLAAYIDNYTYTDEDCYTDGDKNIHVRCCYGLYFKLADEFVSSKDSPIETVLGSQKQITNGDGKKVSIFRRFAGIFEGNGNKIYVNLNTDDLDLSAKLLDNKYCAPFAYVQTATIKNLHVAGTITTKGQFASGLVGSTGPKNSQDLGKCTIENCHVSVTLDNKYVKEKNSYANHGGFIGVAEGNAYITDSWFDGTFEGNDYMYSAGFIGLNKGKKTIDGKKGTILSNCLFNPVLEDGLETTGSWEFVHDLNGGTHTLTNCYWVTHFGEPETAQGQRVVAKENVSQEILNNADYYTEKFAADGEKYYIIRHNPTWMDVQADINDNSLESSNVNTTIVAGTEDAALVIPANRTFVLNLGQEGTLDRGIFLDNAQDDGFVIKIEEGATLTIEGGTITGGNNTGNGGGIYNAGTLNLIGTTVTGNFTAGNGGGIYNTGTLAIDGATITDNQGKNEGCLGIGVYVADEECSFFSIKGKVTISENNYKYYQTTQKKTPHNVYLAGTSVISIIGSLTGSSIYVEGTDDEVASFADLEETVDFSTFPSFFTNDENADMEAYVDAVNEQVRWTPDGTITLSTIPGLTDFLLENLAYSEATYNGSAFEPKFTQEEIMCEGSIGPFKDGLSIYPTYFYISGYLNNTNAGTAYVIISANEEDNIYDDRLVIGSITIPFTIKPRPITITANDQTVFYGNSITGTGGATDVTVTNTDGSTTTSPLVGEQTLTAVTLEASDVDLDSPGTITPKAATIMDGETDVTANYDFTFKSGELTLTPRPITIKAIDQTVTYGEAIQQGTSYVIISNTQTEEETEENTENNTEDNTDNSTENTTENPLVGKQALTAITLTASEGADVETPGTITPSAATIMDGETDMTKYYDITYAAGTLTVSPLSGIVVTITGNHNGYEFDNQEHSVDGYKVEISNPLYTEADFTFSGNAEAKRTEIGTTYMGLNTDQFQNNNSNFNVTFNITDGFMNITYHIASFADNADNSTIISNIVFARAAMSDVILSGRTLYKDGNWNTLCLPFDVDLISADCPLAGADVRELSNASFADGVLELEFTEEGSVIALEAGVPYIIKWAEDTDIFEPRFDGVTLSTELKDKTFDLGDGKSIIFKGTYGPVVFEENKSILLVGEGSTLYYPEAGAFTNAQRAYFQLEGLEVGTVESNAIGLRFGDATGINNVLTPASDATYYDLSGRRVAEPTKGIYIVNGKKVVIK